MTYAELKQPPTDKEEAFKKWKIAVRVIELHLAVEATTINKVELACDIASEGEKHS